MHHKSTRHIHFITNHSQNHPPRRKTRRFPNQPTSHRPNSTDTTSDRLLSSVSVTSSYCSETCKRLMKIEPRNSFPILNFLGCRSQQELHNTATRNESFYFGAVPVHGGLLRAGKASRLRPATFQAPKMGCIPFCVLRSVKSRWISRSSRRG